MVNDGNCKISVTNVIGPEAVYLDQVNWAVVTIEPDQMEILYNSQRCHFYRATLDFTKPITCL